MATKTWWSSVVIVSGTSAVVWPYGQRISWPFVWRVMWALICWTPPTIRLRTKSRITCVSGAENAFGPRYVIDDGALDEPPQQPHAYS